MEERKQKLTLAPGKNLRMVNRTGCAVEHVMTATPECPNGYDYVLHVTILDAPDTFDGVTVTDELKVGGKINLVFANKAKGVPVIITCNEDEDGNIIFLIDRKTPKDKDF